MVPDGYPSELERTVTLKNGSDVRLRPIRPDDACRLIALARRLSATTSYQRFFSPIRELSPERARFLANVDYRHRFAIVAERQAAGEPVVIGVARYDARADGVAEIALVVEDAWQGLGLGAMLADELLRAAEDRGVHWFAADVLSSNHRVLGLLARHTDVVWRQTREGVTALVFRRRPRHAEQTA